MNTAIIRARLNLAPARTNTMRIRMAILAVALATLPAALAFGADKAPDMKPLATCADGKHEYSVTGDHRGACSGHGGVVAWADGSPVKSHKPKTSYR